MTSSPRRINVVSISVADLDRARTFYRDVLRLGEPVYDLPEAGWVEFSFGEGQTNLALTAAGPDFRAAYGTTVVLDVADCFAAAEELRERGARVDEPQVFPGYVTFANVYDPCGNRLQICGPAPDAS